MVYKKGCRFIHFTLAKYNTNILLLKKHLNRNPSAISHHFLKINHIICFSHIQPDTIYKFRVYENLKLSSNVKCSSFKRYFSINSGPHELLPNPLWA